MKNTDNIWDSFLQHLEEQIEEYKKPKETATTSDKYICISNFPMAKEILEQLAFNNLRIKVLNDTVTSMKLEKTSNKSNNSYSKEEKLLINIAEIYQKGVWKELVKNIKRISLYIDNFNNVCKVYTQGICPLKEKIKEARAFLAESPFNKSNKNLENTNLKTAFNNLEIAITNAESKLKTFSQVYSASKFSGAMIEYRFSISKDNKAAYFDKRIKGLQDAATEIDKRLRYLQNK